MNTTPSPQPARIAVLGSGTRSPLMPPHLLELGTPEAVPELINSRLAVFAGNPYDRLVVDLAYVEMAQRAEVAGCAAIFINTYADYGIAAMRAAVSIPVVGAGEAAVTVAAQGGRKFSIVTVWPPSMQFIYDERRRAVAAGAACLRVRHLSAEDELLRLGTEQGVQERMARREDAIVRQIVRECERAIDDDGAQAIVLGCTCMAAVGPQVSAAVDVPVIEGSRVGYLAAAAAARQAPGPVALPRTARGTLVPAIVDAYVSGALGAQAAPAAAECPVCIS